MIRFARTLEVLLGLAFILAAAFKAYDMHTFWVQIRGYGVLRNAELVWAAAYFCLCLETLVGAALVAGFRCRGWTWVLTGALLICFTALISYGWAFHDLEDCGCFGTFIEMGPAESILKNLVMLAMLVTIWQGSRHAAEVAGSRVTATTRCALFGACLAVVLGGAALADQRPAVVVEKAQPFAELVLNDQGSNLHLGRGEYVVAMMSTTCPHCIASVEKLNQFTATPGMPPVVCIMIGDENSLEDFQIQTDPQFPAVLLDNPVAFFQLIHPSDEPPRFIAVRDGAVLKYWDIDVPSVEEVLNVFATAGGG
jgi:hypothetical protein